MKKQYVLGVDIGGTRIRMGLVDREGMLLDAQAQLVADYDEDAFIAGLQGMLADYLRKHPKQEIAAVSVGVPSTLSKDRAVVLSTPNIKGLNNVPLQKLLMEATGLRAFVERDVNFLLYHDCIEMRLPKEGIVMAVYFGTGIGNAVRINNYLLTGRNGVACELGHIPVAGNISLCTCGNTGCIETVASGRYLSELNEAAFPGEPIHEIFLRHAQDSRIETFVEMMTIPVATEINLLDPDEIIIGGGVPAMPGFPMASFEEKLMRHIRKPSPAQGLSIHYAKDSAFNGVKGGAAYAFDQLERE